METETAQLSDQDLLSRWQHEPGSVEARRSAAELLQRYQQRIYRWCRRYVRDHEEALDLAQDVLMTAFENLGRLPAETCFGAWLYAVTRNRCLSEIRRRRVRAEASETEVDLRKRTKDPEEQLLEQLDEDAFLELLKRSLDSEEQEAISLRCFERLPVDEVTSILELTSSSGARGLLQRARRKLRAAMNEERRESPPSQRAEP